MLKIVVLQLLLFLLLHFAGVQVKAQQQVFHLSDSATAEYVPFKASAVEALKSDRLYQYPPRFQPVAESWWERFKQWLWELFRFTGQNQWWENLLYLIAFCVLILAGVYLARLHFPGLFAKKKKAAPLNYTAGEYDLQATDLDTEIAAALAAKNHTLVVRLRYLLALKSLSEAGALEVRQDKTNIDYYYELQEPEQQKLFAELARLFDYIWYGKFVATEAHVQRTEVLLEQLRAAKTAAYV